MAHRRIKGQRKGLSIFNIGDKEYYKLYDTVIVTKESHPWGDKITLDHGGWKTNHTKNCINDFLSRYDFKVFQKDFQWFILGQIAPFSFEGEVTLEVRYNDGGAVIGNFKDKIIRNFA